MTRAALGLAVALAATAAAGPAGAQPPAEGAAPVADVAIAIDVSGSARAASGIDVDGDGTVGINPKLDARLDGRYGRDVFSTDPEDSVLAAELDAVRALLADPRAASARFAIVAFSGNLDPVEGTQLGPPADNARLAAPLGPAEAAKPALDEIAARGPAGGTDFSAAIDAARAALCGGDARPGATRRLLLLTDGVPSLPHGFATRTDQADVSGAIEAAQEAATCGVRIDVFAIGLGATGDPFASKEVSRVTGGTYTPIRQAGALRRALLEVFAPSAP